MEYIKEIIIDIPLQIFINFSNLQFQIAELNSQIQKMDSSNVDQQRDFNEVQIKLATQLNTSQMKYLDVIKELNSQRSVNRALQFQNQKFKYQLQQSTNSMQQRIEQFATHMDNSIIQNCKLTDSNETEHSDLKITEITLDNQAQAQSPEQFNSVANQATFKIQNESIKKTDEVNRNETQLFNPIECCQEQNQKCPIPAILAVHKKQCCNDTISNQYQSINSQIQISNDQTMLQDAIVQTHFFEQSKQPGIAQDIHINKLQSRSVAVGSDSILDRSKEIQCQRQKKAEIPEQIRLLKQTKQGVDTHKNSLNQVMENRNKVAEQCQRTGVNDVPLKQSTKEITEATESKHQMDQAQSKSAAVNVLQDFVIMLYSSAATSNSHLSQCIICSQTYRTLKLEHHLRVTHKIDTIQQFNDYSLATTQEQTRHALNYRNYISEKQEIGQKANRKQNEIGKLQQKFKYRIGEKQQQQGENFEKQDNKQQQAEKQQGESIRQQDPQDENVRNYIRKLGEKQRQQLQQKEDNNSEISDDKQQAEKQQQGIGKGNSIRKQDERWQQQQYTEQQEDNMVNYNVQQQKEDNLRNIIKIQEKQQEGHHFYSTGADGQITKDQFKFLSQFVMKLYNNPSESAQIQCQLCQRTCGYKSYNLEYHLKNAHGIDVMKQFNDYRQATTQEGILASLDYQNYESQSRYTSIFKKYFSIVGGEICCNTCKQNLLKLQYCRTHMQEIHNIIIDVDQRRGRLFPQIVNEDGSNVDVNIIDEFVQKYYVDKSNSQCKLCNKHFKYMVNHLGSLHGLDVKRQYADFCKASNNDEIMQIINGKQYVERSANIVLCDTFMKTANGVSQCQICNKNISRRTFPLHVKRSHFLDYDVANSCFIKIPVQYIEQSAEDQGKQMEKRGSEMLVLDSGEIGQHALEKGQIEYQSNVNVSQSEGQQVKATMELQQTVEQQGLALSLDNMEIQQSLDDNQTNQNQEQNQEQSDNNNSNNKNQGGTVNKSANQNQDLNGANKEQAEDLLYLQSQKQNALSSIMLSQNQNGGQQADAATLLGDQGSKLIIEQQARALLVDNMELKQNLDKDGQISEKLIKSDKLNDTSNEDQDETVSKNANQIQDSNGTKKEAITDVLLYLEAQKQNASSSSNDQSRQINVDQFAIQQYRVDNKCKICGFKFSMSHIIEFHGIQVNQQYQEYINARSEEGKKSALDYIRFLNLQHTEQLCIHKYLYYYNQIAYCKLCLEQVAPQQFIKHVCADHIFYYQQLVDELENKKRK